MSFSPLVLFAVSLLAATPNHLETRSYIIGFTAYAEGDYELAVDIWEQLAQQGDAQSQYALGVLYELGHGPERDYRRAADWYQRAAEQGYAMARNNLGMLYESGLGVAQDFAVAKHKYEQAARQGLPSAQYNLALMHYQGLGTEQDYTVASEWMRKAAEQGFASAQYNLGIMYQRGEGVPRNDVAAAQWYIEAARWGAPRAEASLRSLLQDKRRSTTSKPAAVRKAPDISASVLTRLEAGEQVYTLEQRGKWIAIVLKDGRTLGWIEGETLKGQVRAAN